MFLFPLFSRAADCNAIQDFLKNMTGARSVPRVFIGGKCVGGGTDVQQLQKSGKLVDLLKKAGALWLENKL